jgi:uncharacterized protein YggU (UPF0235/DUF167 family)
MERRIQVKVVPGASREEVRCEVGEDGGAVYRVYVRAVAEDGKANKAVAEVLATHFGVAKRDVQLLQGATGRRKVFVIKD